MEIELRVKIKNTELLKKKLKQLPDIVETKSDERQIDTYLKNENDTERKLVIRIRKNYTSNQALLTFKGKAISKYDIAWQDYDTTIENPDQLEDVLVSNGYIYVCLIDKLRQSFSYKDFEINIDNVKNLGLFIEIEKNGTKNEVENIKKEIIELLNKLGLNNSDIINQGYVQLILNKN